MAFMSTVNNWRTECESNVGPLVLPLNIPLSLIEAQMEKKTHQND